MVAYKLVRKLKDGSLAPLFINKRQRLAIGCWLEAHTHPTEGFKERKGWHCAAEPLAPHLSLYGRVWVEVEIDDYIELVRPPHQGGVWYIAQRMKIITEI